MTNPTQGLHRYKAIWDGTMEVVTGEQETVGTGVEVEQGRFRL